MDMRWNMVGVALAGVVAVGCMGEISTPRPHEDGLTISRAEAEHFTAAYRAGDHWVNLEARIRADDARVLVVTSPEGEELARVQSHPDGQVQMAYYGEAMDMTASAEHQEQARRWLESEEAQLVASAWRDLADTPTGEMPAAENLLQYGIHLDEVLGKIGQEAAGDDRGHRCGDCFGACGPGCWSIGSSAYCAAHDCCCDHYGSWSCFTWCFAYPKCPDAGAPCSN